MAAVVFFNDKWWMISGMHVLYRRADKYLEMRFTLGRTFKVEITTNLLYYNEPTLHKLYAAGNAVVCCTRATDKLLRLCLLEAICLEIVN